MQVTRDYMTQTWKRRIIPQSLEAHGLWIIVDEEAPLSWNRHEYMEARTKRQGGASASVAKNVNNNNQQERKWASGHFATMAAAGTRFGNSQTGNFPAWAPEHAEAQPPARNAPFFQSLKPLVKRFISWLEYSTKD
eukprot:6194946-Pyramimonas_sp.AAC.1